MAESAAALGPDELTALRARHVTLTDAERYYQTHAREFAPAWYPWQLAFGAATRKHSAVMLLAGNRTGKTLHATYVQSLLITQRYPKGWEGRRLARQEGEHWALGVDNRQVRDVLQRHLLGIWDGEFWAGGWLHNDEIEEVIWSPHFKGLVSEAHIRNRTGRLSRLQLRAYTHSSTGQASLPFAGSSVETILVDEQPPDEIVGQLTVRTMTGDKGRGGLILYSMTPERGMTALVKKFMEDRKPNEALIGPIAWSDCAHLTPELQAQMLATLPPHERDMRSRGVPMVGTGLVFPVSEDAIRVEPFSLEDKTWWKFIKGIDLGWEHPTACAWVAYDPDNDTMYLTRVYRKAEAVPAIHAAAINAVWPGAPTVFPHDIEGREKGSGKTMRQYYAEGGLSNSVDFKNPDGSQHVEPGLAMMLERMETGRFKVFASCSEFFEEMRQYHREDGRLIKVGEDVISATRYAAVMVAGHGGPMKETIVAIPEPMYGMRF